MKVKLLKENYKKNEDIYLDFMNGDIKIDKAYFSTEEYEIPNEIPDFPIYLANSELEDYISAIKILKKYMVNTNREVHLNGRFWHSYLIQEKREFILKKYPKVKESFKEFNKIVIKKFDWENYIYKCMLLASYIDSENINDEYEMRSFIKTIYNNLDLFNYIIKTSIFRNSKFVYNFFNIIEEENLSAVLKKQIKEGVGLSKDERYGRKVVFELNKKYPIIMSPFLEKDELKSEIYKALRLYDYQG